METEFGCGIYCDKGRGDWNERDGRGRRERKRGRDLTSAERDRLGVDRACLLKAPLHLCTIRDLLAMSRLLSVPGFQEVSGYYPLGLAI